MCFDRKFGKVEGKGFGMNEQVLSGAIFRLITHPIWGKDCSRDKISVNCWSTVDGNVCRINQVLICTDRQLLAR